MNHTVLRKISLKARKELINKVRKSSKEEVIKDQVIEEVAYLWFRLFIVMRFIDVNFSLIFKIERLKVIVDENDRFKIRLSQICKDLEPYFPTIFTKMHEHFEKLFPYKLLDQDSFIFNLFNEDLISIEDWKNVEILGWLHQYYFSLDKDKVIKSKKKYKAVEIPYATQLFTPEWIVKYLVQNTIGRYWISHYPEHGDLTSKWEFYIESDYKIERQKQIELEQIKCVDPAMGCGHILVYVFDILVEIYERAGYSRKQIPKLILEKNIYGMDIDQRAYELASFVLVAKALKIDPEFFMNTKMNDLHLNVICIEDTASLSKNSLTYLKGKLSNEELKAIEELLDQFTYAKSIGSLLQMDVVKVKKIELILKKCQNYSFLSESENDFLKMLYKLLKQAKLLTLTFDIYITNPPYIGSKFLPKTVNQYLQHFYYDGRGDLFSAFIVHSFQKTKSNGLIGLMTPFVWMFISSYELLRKKIIQEKTIHSLVQLEYSAFEGATVPICLFTLQNGPTDNEGDYFRLIDFKGANSQAIHLLSAINQKRDYHYKKNQKQFLDIPGNPIAYWVTNQVESIFKESTYLHEITHSFQGIITGNNHEFVKFWYEVPVESIAFDYENIEDVSKNGKKWIPYNKGGKFRKWYGNNEYILLWKDDGKHLTRPRSENRSYYLKEGITWSFITSSEFSARYFGEGFLWDVAGSSLFLTSKYYSLLEILAFLNSCVNRYFIQIFNPTLNFQVENMMRLPLIKNEQYTKKIKELTLENIQLSKEDWDSFETSWDFSTHPFIQFKNNERHLHKIYKKWEEITVKRRVKIKANEEEINRYMIQSFQLEHVLHPEISENDISLRMADPHEDAKSFLSYVIGCIFGRYSLHQDGVVFAGGLFDKHKFAPNLIVEDNLLVLSSSLYNQNDIVSKIKDYLSAMFGVDTVEENLTFLAKNVNLKSSSDFIDSEQIIRNYFQSQFYKDHNKTYKKRPIYWQISSGQLNVFQCLIYIHRYESNIWKLISTKHIAPLIKKLKEEIRCCENLRSKVESVKLKYLKRQLEEAINFQMKIANLSNIEIDLNQGIDVNYAKFNGVVSKIK